MIAENFGDEVDQPVTGRARRGRPALVADGVLDDSDRDHVLAAVYVGAGDQLGDERAVGQLSKTGSTVFDLARRG